MLGGMRFPSAPPPDLIPSCAQGGVLGPAVGVMGSLQAVEVCKEILGLGESLSGTLLMYDALGTRFRTIRITRLPDCPVCGTHPTVKELIDYEQFCGIKPAETSVGETITDDMQPRELKERLDRGEPIVIVDVREPQEYQINRIQGSKLIPLGELPQRIDELDENAAIVCQCK